MWSICSPGTWWQNHEIWIQQKTCTIYVSVIVMWIAGRVMENRSLHSLSCLLSSMFFLSCSQQLVIDFLGMIRRQGWKERNKESLWIIIVVHFTDSVVGIIHTSFTFHVSGRCFWSGLFWMIFCMVCALTVSNNFCLRDLASASVLVHFVSNTWTLTWTSYCSVKKIKKNWNMAVLNLCVKKKVNACIWWCIKL